LSHFLEVVLTQGAVTKKQGGGGYIVRKKGRPTLVWGSLLPKKKSGVKRERSIPQTKMSRVRILEAEPGRVKAVKSTNKTRGK